MLNSILFNDREKTLLAIADAKNIFGENTPYIVREVLEGDQVVFNDVFINNVIKAMTTGCMPDMGSSSKTLLYNWLGDQYHDWFTIELDKWLVNMVNNIPNYSLDKCINDK